MKLKTFLFLSTILFGCHYGNQKTIKQGDLHVIDISKNHPEKEVILQNVADIEYVPLETTDDILLSGVCQLAYLSDKYVVVWEPRLGDIFIFDRNGKVITHFNHRGQGDKEYVFTANVIFDEKNEEIFIFDSQTRRILVYTLTGEYKRILKYSEDYSRLNAYNFDDGAFLVYDESNWFDHTTYNKEPYMFMSKKDGSIVSALDISLPVRYYNRASMAVEINGQTATSSLSINAPNNRYYGQNLLIADFSSDTIYRLDKNKELTPLIIRKPSVHSSEPRTVLTHQLATDKFVYLAKITLDFEAAKNNQSYPNTEFIYEFETGETSRVSFVNDDYPSDTWWVPFVYPEISQNMAASLIQTPGLKTAFDKKQLKGELEKLTATLDTEDNPVLMIVKFK